MLLLTEFRVHAARNPEINRRYAEAHERTISGLASVLAGLQERDAELPLPPRQLAEFMLTVGFGAALEQAANPDALGGPLLAQRIAGLITSQPAARPPQPGRTEEPRMTSTCAPDRSVLRSRLSGAIGAHMPGAIDRLGWDAGRLAAYQRDRLRALLARAATRSPFHARRLGGIDARRFELAGLARLPVMTKDEMMAGFDEVVTDPRLRRPVVDARRPLAAAIAPGGPPPEGLRIGIVGAASPVHSSGFAAALAGGPPIELIPAPVTLPLAEIVARLNAASPPALLGYPTMLRRLGDERRAGRLRIAPRSVTAMSELLIPADAAGIAEAFGVGVIDMFVSTEGLVGHSEPGGRVLSFASDLCLAELVDSGNWPGPAGTSSAKVLVTNLHNLTQPLIRYELTDRFTPRPPGPHHGHLRVSVDGRNDAPLRYGDVEVHPLVIRTVFTKAPAIREYQVHQTEWGVRADVVADGALDTAAVARSVEASLRAAGVPGPRAEVRVVSAIQRHPESGKVRRFVPLLQVRTREARRRAAARW